MKVALALGLPIAVISPVGSASWSAEPITKLESRDLPQSQVRKRLLSQLGAILVAPPPAKYRQPPQRPLEDLWYWTIPTKGYAKGVCRANLVRFEFEPVGGPGRGADTPVKVVGLTSAWQYHFSDGDTPCRSLSPQEGSFSSAPEERVFLEGYRALSALQQSLQAGGGVTLDCPGSSSETCKDRILQAELEDVVSYDRCDHGEGDPLGWACVVASAGDFEVRMYGPYLRPDALHRVRVNEFIVLSHERID